MLDRQKIEAVLTRRFPTAKHADVAAATNAIMGLSLTDEWEEVSDIHCLPQEFDRNAEYRFFRRREC